MRWRGGGRHVSFYKVILSEENATGQSSKRCKWHTSNDSSYTVPDELVVYITTGKKPSKCVSLI